MFEQQGVKVTFPEFEKFENGIPVSVLRGTKTSIKKVIKSLII